MPPTMTCNKLEPELLNGCGEIKRRTRSGTHDHFLNEQLSGVSPPSWINFIFFRTEKPFSLFFWLFADPYISLFRFLINDLKKNENSYNQTRKMKQTCDSTEILQKKKPSSSAISILHREAYRRV